MKITGLGFLQTILLVLFFYTLLTGLAFPFLLAHADYPCYVHYTAADNCIERYEIIRTEYEEQPRIEVLLTILQAWVSGGGCHHKWSATDSLDVQTSMLDFRLERQGGSLIMGGKLLAQGAEFRLVDVLHWNPWVVSKISFWNLGLVSDCTSPGVGPRIVVVGSYGTEVSLIKGLLLLAATLGGLLITFRMAREQKAHRRQRPSLLDLPRHGRPRPGDESGGDSH